MDESNLFNLREAAFLLGEDFNVLRKELEANLDVRPLIERAPNGIRLLPLPMIVYLHLLQKSKGKITGKGREALFELMFSPESTNDEKFGFGRYFFVDIEKASEDVKAKVEKLNKIRDAVELKSDVHCIRDTQIDVYRVAALAATSIDEAKFEFPSLAAPQIEAAKLYAEIYARSGRRYPSQSAKRLLLEADFGELNKEVTQIRSEGGQYVAEDNADDGGEL